MRRLLPWFHGWTIVAAVHVLLALAFGAMYAFGVFFEALQAQFHAGRFSVASIFSATALLSYLVGTVSGPLADRLSVRAVVALGAALLAAGFALGSQAASLQQLQWRFSIFVGLGIGLIYVPAVTVVQRWFIRQRSRASGLALAGTGLGTLLCPLLAGLLLQSLGLSATMQIFAAGIALLGLAAASQLYNHPQDAGLAPDGDASAASPPAGSGMGLLQAIGSTRFQCLFLAIALTSVSLFAATVHISPHARGLGVAAPLSNSLIGLIGVGNLLGRLLLGGLADRLGRLPLLALLTLALALLHLLWWQAGGYAGLAWFALLFGACHGGCITLYPTLAADWFGTRHLGAILGALYISVGIAAWGGASLAGWFFDQTGGYGAAILASGTAALAAAACLLTLAQRGKTPVPA